MRIDEARRTIDGRGCDRALHKGCELAQELGWRASRVVIALVNDSGSVGTADILACAPVADKSLAGHERRWTVDGGSCNGMINRR